MNRVHTPQTLPLLLMVTAAVWAAHATEKISGAAPATTNGAYAVTFRVKAPTTVSSGSIVTCKARIAPRLSALDSLTGQTAPAQSAQGVATLVGASANCTVVLPFSFAGVDPRDKASLSYEIDAANGSGLEAVRKQDGIAVPYPQAGGIASVRLDVNF